MVPSYLYVVNFQRQTVSTAITLVQVKCGATGPLELVRAALSQKGSTTSAQECIQIVRKTAAATVAGFTPLKLNAGDPVSQASSSSTSCGTIATAEGSDGDVLVEDGFNVLNGWLWLPTPEERILVQSSSAIGLKFPTAPASQSWSGALYFREFRG